jgi:hypothetical protein
VGQLRTSLEDLHECGQLGDWAFAEGDSHIFIRLPRPGTDRGEVSAIPLSPAPQPDVDDWQWDGNREAPTLTPSINWVGVWHGYLRAGQLVTA